ncbi:MAG: hypothetical protein JO019_03190 [Candidatus Kaiserbacteria bacterium]|nr:hypothetical protein [Candidatus Kaiserbacteria bacterium]
MGNTSGSGTVSQPVSSNSGSGRSNSAGGSTANTGTAGGTKTSGSSTSASSTYTAPGFMSDTCSRSGAYQLWFILLAIFVLLTAFAAFSQPPLAQKSPAIPVALILIPLILLIGFWYFAPMCRAATWIPVVLLIIAIAGLLVAFRESREAMLPMLLNATPTPPAVKAEAPKPVPQKPVTPTTSAKPIDQKPIQMPAAKTTPPQQNQKPGEQPKK